MCSRREAPLFCGEHVEEGAVAHSREAVMCVVEQAGSAICSARRPDCGGKPLVFARPKDFDPRAKYGSGDCSRLL